MCILKEAGSAQRVPNETDPLMPCQGRVFPRHKSPCSESRQCISAGLDPDATQLLKLH